MQHTMYGDFSVTHQETRIVQGAKSIFHLEAFAAKFMYTFKQYLISMDTF